MIIAQLPTGDQLHKYMRCLVVPFQGKRKVMSTSMHNGGYREDLTAIYNHDVNPGVGRLDEHKYQDPDALKDFMEESLGLDYHKTANMATIVSMEDAVISSRSYDELSVTAVATASAELNAIRVGQGATSYEKSGEYTMLRPETINIMVFTNADMTPGCMARTIVTATEAKTAVLQELIAGSNRTSEIATGTGTDNVMVVANPESDNLLTYGGGHGKLGELVGVTVMEAVRASLENHSGLSAKSQHSVLSRMARFGLSEEALIESYKAKDELMPLPLPQFIHNIHELSKKDEIVTLTSLYVHLLDQLSWGLISPKEAANGGSFILSGMGNVYGLDLDIQIAVGNSTDQCKVNMLKNYMEQLMNIAIK